MEVRPGKTSHAFTLVELLVVISIVGVLMSLLLPSMLAAKKNAQEVVCKNNLRQQGIAFGFYRVDNRDYYPCTWNIERASPAVYDPTDTTSRAKFPWAVLLNSYAAAPIGTWTTWENKSYTGLPGTSIKNIYTCPLGRSGWGIFNATGGVAATASPDSGTSGGNYSINPYIFTFKYDPALASSYAPAGNQPHYSGLYGPLPLQREAAMQRPDILILTWDAPVGLGYPLASYATYVASPLADHPSLQNHCYLSRTLAGVPYHGNREADMIASIGDGSVKMFKSEWFTSSVTQPGYQADVYYNRQVGNTSKLASIVIP